MAARTDEVRSALEQVAMALLDDIDGIARRSVARMQKMLPSYAEMPAEALVAVTLTNTRNLPIRVGPAEAAGGYGCQATAART